MTNKDDGGLVYPKTTYTSRLDPKLNLNVFVPDGQRPGLTRRDWLAGLAMQGMVANGTNIKVDIKPDESTEEAAARANKLIARICYTFADAMISESRRTEGEQNTKG